MRNLMVTETKPLKLNFPKKKTITARKATIFS